MTRCQMEQDFTDVGYVMHHEVCRLCVHSCVSQIQVTVLSTECVFLLEHVFCEGLYTTEVKTRFSE
jgi:hypothetical protein